MRTPRARTSPCVMEGAAPWWMGLLGRPEEGEGLGKRCCGVLKGWSLELNCLMGGAHERAEREELRSGVRNGRSLEGGTNDEGRSIYKEEELRITF